MSKRERGALLVILAAALAIRLAWSIYAARPPGPGLHDPGFYRHLAEQLAHFDGYTLPDGTVTAYYPPGYSFSLAPFLWLLYNTPLPDDMETGVIAALNIVWQLGTIALAFLVARRVTGAPAAALVTAAVLAVWPNLVVHTAVALTESLFLFLLMLAVLLVVQAPWDGRRWEPWRLLSVGALLGAATLVRPVTVPLFVVLLVALGIAGGGRRAVAYTGAMLAVSLAVVGPWVVRNAVVMDQATLSTNTGDNLCMSRRVGGSGGFEFENPRCFDGPFVALDRPEFETGRDAHGRKVAFRFIREHPMEELKLVGRRLAQTFRSDADGVEAVESYGTDRFLPARLRTTIRWLSTVYGAVAGALGVAGLAVLVRRRSEVALFLALAGVGLLVPPLLFFGDPRFHVPAVPLAAVGVGVLVAARHRGESPIAAP